MHVTDFLRVLCNLEFLGANEFDDRPFVVMPYLENGNARDYVRSHPECDRLRIVRPCLYLDPPCV